MTVKKHNFALNSSKKAFSSVKQQKTVKTKTQKYNILKKNRKNHREQIT
jgi:hypothetical protein